MRSKIIGGILITAFLAVAACRTGVFTQRTQPVETPVAIYPMRTFDLPAMRFHFQPPQPSIDPTDLSRKLITDRFTATDREHVRSTDPRRFTGGRDEIIYLSLLRDGDYAFPLPGAKVISPYAGRRAGHTGVDLKTRANDTIRAAFDGIVRMAKPYAAYGNVIVVRHYNGLETVYSHNSRNLVQSGDAVRAGQPIALTGRTGRATTEHLHFEARINGAHFNPALLFDFTARSLQPRNLVCSKKGSAIDVRAVDLMPHQLMGAYSDPRYTDDSSAN